MKIKSIHSVKLDAPKQYYDVINANPYNNFFIKTNDSYVCSHNCFFDEISFVRNQSVEKQKQIALDMIDTAVGGMKTRFLNHGKNPTLLVLCSSKRSDKSFLEEHMKKKIEDDSSSALIVDEPVWNVKPPETYCGKKFYVAQGNRFLASEIIPEEDNLNNWRDKGYTILEVPIEFKENFREDIDRALCDFAGVSSSELTKYIYGARVALIRDTSYKNPFNKNIIEVGNAPNDFAQYQDFFDMDCIDKSLMDRPLFVHLDMSISGDKTGIAGVWILGKKHSSDNESSSQELYFKLAFSVSIKAPKGYQISFAKNREFIYWLKSAGFNLKGVSTDTFQNASLAQDLISKGYPYEIISVDRVDPASKICQPYAYFKNAIYEKRITMYEDNHLVDEILCLERNGNTGKIDHPDGQAKDKADAVCGALYNASRHGDEFAFFWGEDIDALLETNTRSSEVSKQQIVVDMNEELNKMFDPMKDYAVSQTKKDINSYNSRNSNNIAFDPFFIANGIIV